MADLIAVTIVTDASFHNDYKVGGYAFIIKSVDRKMTCSGLLKQVNDSTDAELMAIANALVFLKNVQPKKDVPGIMLYVDSVMAVGLIHSSQTNAVAVQVAKIIKDLESHFNCKVAMSHIKSHTKGVDQLSLMNEACDKEAKREMRTYVNKIKKAKSEMLWTTNN